MIDELRTISLFSGGGGMDLGFEAAGFHICCSIDKDPYSCNTIALNSGKKKFSKQSTIVIRDIRKLDSDEILHDAGLRRSQLDLIIGGPPCQAFSVFGRRRGVNDPRGNLVWEFLRIIGELNPLAFVFENVAGLRTIHNGSLYQEILESLSLDGKYVVSDHNYELADFGVPQFRNRIFFIGWRNGRRIPPLTPTHGPNIIGLRPFNTAGKVLAGLPSPGRESSLPNHIGRDHSQRIVDRYRKLAFGERDSKTRINKLHPERPSFTIIVGSDAGGGKGHVHPFEPREVTPRESARLQTFPDWWEFSGTGRHVIRQVGNAVPPLFAAQLAGHVRRFVFGIHDDRTIEDYIRILGLNYLNGADKQ